MIKVIYFLKNRLHYYPPCVSQIRMINHLGVNIEVVYGTCHQSTLDLLKEENIKCTKICNLKEKNNTLFGKLLSYTSFRMAASRIMKKYNSKNTIFWFGTTETVIPLFGKLKKYNYIVTMLELLDDSHFKNYLMSKICKNAQAVACCEKNRAYLMKFEYKLKNMPYIFPNKPFSMIRNRNIEPTSEITKSIINKIKGKNILLSQGELQTENELIEFAKALNHTKRKYTFVLMGVDRYNCVNKLKEYYDDVIYFEYVPAPLHLEITSYARIGINFYVPNCLNKVYCAPNKIYEFSGFGIPIIGNNIPGLENTIGNSKAGICIELTENNIINAIDTIDDNYENYSKNALEFFDSTDNLVTMKKMLEDQGMKL